LVTFAIVPSPKAQFQDEIDPFEPPAGDGKLADASKLTVNGVKPLIGVALKLAVGVTLSNNPI